MWLTLIAGLFLFALDFLRYCRFAKELFRVIGLAAEV